MRKYILIVGDGMSDLPTKALQGRTPLSVARKPAMDSLAKRGVIGLFQSVRPDFPSKGTDTAHLSLLGFDPRKDHPGRGAMEAAAYGVSLGPRDRAFRMNFVTVENGVLTDYGAGNLDEERGMLFFKAFEQKFRLPFCEFYHLGKYRNLLITREHYSHEVILFPPHDYVGKPLERLRPTASSDDPRAKQTATLLNTLMDRSYEFFQDHPLNHKLIREGKKPVTHVWFWGQGPGSCLPSFLEKYGLTGAVIGSVDVLLGLARLLGLSAIRVRGPTHHYDIDYRERSTLAIDVLKSSQFVLIHCETPDEAAHMGDAKAKISTIEKIDEDIVAPLLSACEAHGWTYTIAITSDHTTATDTQQHEYEPVPVLRCRSEDHYQHTWTYDEFHASKGIRIKRFMDFFLEA